MTENNSSANPFSELLPGSMQENNNPDNVNKVNSLVQDVFYITLNKDAIETNKNCEHLVYLEELATSLFPQTTIDLETLEQALFERLLLLDPSAAVIPANSKNSFGDVAESKVIIYLFNSNEKLRSYPARKDDAAIVKAVKSLILRNAVTALKQPDLFAGQNLTEQILDLLKEPDKAGITFIDDVVNEFMDDVDPDSHKLLKHTFTRIMRKLAVKVRSSDIISMDLFILPAVQLFASNRHLAPMFMEECTPNDVSKGYAYSESLLGTLLELSPLPRMPNKPHQFFQNPMDVSSVTMTENAVWTAIKHLVDNLHQIILTLLRSSTTKKNMLKWIGGCLQANIERGKLWNLQNVGPNLSSVYCVSDGFMINLGAVLLRLAQPFCHNIKSLKIDPTYCAVQSSSADEKSVHMPFLFDETCILPPSEDSEGNAIPRPTATTYSFVTECFFMTQKCLDLGYRVVVEKLSRLSQELSRTDRLLVEAEAGEAGIDASSIEMLKVRMRNDLTVFTSLRCVLLEPSTLVMLEPLHATTCNWLVQVAVHPVQQGEAKDSYAPLTELPVNFPIATAPPCTLWCIPEFIIENIVKYVSFSKRMVAMGVLNSLVTFGETYLSPMLTMVVTFMGSAERIRNPHLRAGLAECLESMLPTLPEGSNRTPHTLNLFFREQLFKEHPHRLELARSLLDVFVGIEMTGQSVQFEQKFNYRLPMYLVMDYLWEIEEHKQCFILLAEEAEANMEAVQPPIFLRFVNLLMNDAIFLLDEALSNMSLIRKLQAERDSGAWATLTASERSSRSSTLMQTSQMARFDNILGRDTGRSLRRVAAAAPGLLSRPALAPRIAAMLNYFLQQLVGPNRSTFKVKDSKEYEFDPAKTVMDICHMYTSLGDSDDFCLAVSDDGRSYSPQLFSYAEEVLARIGGGTLIGDLRRVAERVQTLATLRLQDEETLAEAPEEFLDPIMSTLMLDPVILPSSKTTVDRSTIARHLLSDQSDPFNRSPLTMDQVIPDIELKDKITSWILQRRQGASSIGAQPVHAAPST